MLNRTDSIGNPCMTATSVIFCVDVVWSASILNLESDRYYKWDGLSLLGSCSFFNLWMRRSSHTPLKTFHILQKDWAVFVEALHCIFNHPKQLECCEVFGFQVKYCSGLRMLCLMYMLIDTLQQDFFKHYAHNWLVSNIPIWWVSS